MKKEKKVVLVRCIEPMCLVTGTLHAKEGELRSLTSQEQKQLGYYASGEAVVWVEKEEDFNHIRKLNATELFNKLNTNNTISNAKKYSALVEKFITSKTSPYRFMLVDRRKDGVGYGLVSCQDIPADSVLLLYSGQLKMNGDEKDDSELYFNFVGNQYGVEPLGGRSAATFIQHAPLDPKDVPQLIPLASPEMKRFVKENLCSEFSNLIVTQPYKLATANTNIRQIDYNGVPLLVVVAHRNINKGDELFYDYGPRSKIRRIKYFDLKNGAIIPQHCICRRSSLAKLASFAGIVGQINFLKNEPDKINKNNKSHQPTVTVDEKSLEHSILLEVRKFKARAFPAIFTSDAKFGQRLRQAAADGKDRELAGYLQIKEYAFLVNQQDSNPKKRYSPLHWACFNGHLECVKQLLIAKAHVNILNADGQQPIKLAIDRGYEQIVLLIIQTHPDLYHEERWYINDEMRVDRLLIGYADIS